MKVEEEIRSLGIGSDRGQETTAGEISCSSLEGKSGRGVFSIQAGLDNAAIHR